MVRGVDYGRTAAVLVHIVLMLIAAPASAWVSSWELASRQTKSIPSVADGKKLTFSMGAELPVGTSGGLPESEKIDTDHRDDAKPAQDDLERGFGLDICLLVLPQVKMDMYNNETFKLATGPFEGEEQDVLGGLGHFLSWASWSKAPDLEFSMGVAPYSNMSSCKAGDKDQAQNATAGRPRRVENYPLGYMDEKERKRYKQNLYHRKFYRRAQRTWSSWWSLGACWRTGRCGFGWTSCSRWVSLWSPAHPCPRFGAHAHGMCLATASSR